ncbi:MAG: TonB-dependent receptor, partial [Acidobacteria bacterium]|nr:TonB-dependent receptor [Acidobacteriota bacterium]
MDIDADEHPGDSHARLKTEMWVKVYTVEKGVSPMGCRIGFLAFVCSLSAFSQVSTSRLEGYVLDPAGAMVPGAAVTAVAGKTRNTVAVRSDSAGFYVFPSLAPDTYMVTAESQGFRKLVINALELGAGAIVSQNIRLEVGQVTESVTVEARSEQIQTADSQVSRSVSLREVEGLPQLGRGPLSLINYQAGMSVDPNNSSFTRLNGTRQGSNTILIDGISGTEPVTPRSGNPGVAINTDTIEELRVVSAGGKAEYGRQGGGQIELITRTGTNKWSGSLSNFHRNTVLNANNWFNNASGAGRPSLVQNLFSGSIGGPIRRDKTFVFFNYQGRRTANQVVRNRTVPTAEFRRGLFRWTAPGSGEIRSFDITANDPRRIGVDKEMQRQFELMPLPNNFENGDRLNTAGFRWNVPAPSTEDAYTVRVDHHLTSTHRVFFRGSLQDILVTDTVNSNEARFPGRPNATQPNKRKGFSIGSDWTIAPTLINELRAGYQNGDINFVRPDRLAGPMLTSNSWTEPLNTATSNRRHSPLRELTNNLSHLRGHHTLKGGVNIRMLRQFSTNDANIFPNVVLTTANGNVPPANIGPTGAAISSADRQRFENLYNDFLGRMSSVTVTYQTDLEKFLPAGSPRVRNNDYLDFSWFLQDDWKVTPRLTLSYGLRWELFRAPRERDGLQGRFEGIDRVSPLGGIDNLTVTRDPNWYVNDRNNFAPRFGFAWDPWGNGKTAIRGSYGIYYERSIGSVWNTVDANTPGFTQAVVVFPNNTASSDLRWSDGVPVAPIPVQTITRQPNNRQTTVVAFDPNLRTPYVQQFTFNVQREIFRNSVIDVGW